MDGNAPPHTWLTTGVGEYGQRIAKMRAGTRWDSLRVAKVLSSDALLGTIVESELFDAAQTMLADTPSMAADASLNTPCPAQCGTKYAAGTRSAARQARLQPGCSRMIQEKAINAIRSVTTHA